jgi:hypothetical protein
MNAINFIIPYRHEGMWVFDDPRVGLAKEPFVSGADTMIDVLVADISDRSEGFSTAFLCDSVPGLQSEVGMEAGGVWRQLVFLI